MVLRFKILLAHLALIVCASASLQSATGADFVTLCFVNNQPQPVQFKDVQGFGVGAKGLEAYPLGCFELASNDVKIIDLPREFAQGVSFLAAGYMNGAGAISSSSKKTQTQYSRPAACNILVVVAAYEPGIKSIMVTQDDPALEVIMAARAAEAVEEGPTHRRSAPTMTSDDLAEEFEGLGTTGADMGAFLDGEATTCAAGDDGAVAGAGSGAVGVEERCSKNWQRLARKYSLHAQQQILAARQDKKARSAAQWGVLSCALIENANLRAVVAARIAEEEEAREEVEIAAMLATAAEVGTTAGGAGAGAGADHAGAGRVDGGEGLVPDSRPAWYWRLLGY